MPALAALKRLADLSRSEDERVALAATQELLNRASARPPPQEPRKRRLRASRLVIKIVRFSDTIESEKGAQK
jgi:hypothetical protein